WPNSIQVNATQAPDALDIQRAPRPQKPPSPRRVRRAENIFTAPRDKLRIAPDLPPTDGAFAMDVLEKIERLGIARPFRLNNFDHCRNHFTGFFDHNRIADANVFALDLVLVVQRRAR